MTNCMSAEKIGVGEVGLPTTIFSESTCLPAS